MKRRKPLTFFVILALGVMVVCAGANDDHGVAEKLDVAGLHNVFRISDRLYSGSGPDGDEAFASLKKLGIKTILSVDGAKPDVERAKAFGLRYIHVPIGYNGVPREQALQIAKAVREIPGPFYIHCHHGKHRGPAAAAVARLCSDEECRVDDALAVLRIAGTDSRYSGLFKSIREFRRSTTEELEKLPAELPAVANVAGLTQAMVTLDHTWDNLKLVRVANWQAPPDHADIDPAHEALQLLENYQELLRLAELKSRPPDFQKWAEAGQASAKELEQILRAVNDKARVNGNAAEKSFQRASAACAQCHAKYRDLP